MRKFQNVLLMSTILALLILSTSAPFQRRLTAPQQKAAYTLTNKPLRERLRYHYPYASAGQFPAYIWQTWKHPRMSSHFTQDLRRYETSWTEMNPTFDHQVIPDEMLSSIIQQLYASVPEITQIFDALPLPVLRADFFRYLILLAHGGVYSDIDTTALQPVQNWLPAGVNPREIGLVIGIEADPDRPDWQQWYSRRVQFCQWTIQSQPGHPILVDIVASITEEAIRMKIAGLLEKDKMDRSVLEFTGPAAWTDAIFRFFNDAQYFDTEHGAITYESFTNQVSYQTMGDVLILPITSFSAGVGHMRAQGVDHPLAFVKHAFQGLCSSHMAI